MGMENRTIYIIEPNTRASSILNDYEEQRDRQWDQIKDLVKETASAVNGFWGTRSTPLKALISSNDVPVTGFRKKKQYDGTITMFPDKRTKVGKAASQRFREINQMPELCRYRGGSKLLL